MRHLLQLFFLLVFSASLWAQAPQQFKFQAVARDAGGSPYASANLAVRVSIVRDGVSGLVDYAERHTITTSPLGVFDLAIGDGVPLSGMMTDVDWANHPYYLKIDIDPAGGTSYLNLGTSQLLSVPYAIYAGESGSGGGGDPTDELQNLIYDPVTQILTLTDGNSVTLNTGGGTDSQTLTFDPLSGSLSISNGNTINIPAGTPGPQGPQGEAGPTGPAGPQGTPGTPGAAGPAGPQGIPGAAGPAGPQGPAGTGINLLGTVATVGDLPAGANQGDLYIVTASGDGYAWDGSMWNNVGQIQGPQGAQGDTGPAGMTGPTGASGPAGPQGPIGSTGPAGPQGPTGPQGATGPQGPAGQDGTGISIQGTVATVGDLPAGGNTQGDLYIVSADGNGYVWDGTMWTNVGQIQGPQGPQGAPGPQGTPGSTGPAGPAGPTGATGPIGPQGTQGLTGPQGTQGDTGPAGPVGPIGPQGAQGLTGPQGTQGDAGPAGPTGATGPIGPQGAQGLTGPAGPAGPMGATGSTGPIGPQGAQGLTGPQGAQGDAGPAGPTGATGPIGPVGPQGIQGLTGSAGPTGPIGPQGIPGPIGPTGATGPVGPQGPAGEIELPYYDETTTPGAAFHIHNNAEAAYGIVGSNSPGGEILPANRAGVLGHAFNGHGVYGYSENSFYAGVQGVSNSNTGYGVLGYGFGGGIGGYFYTTSGGQAALTTGVGNVGIGTNNPEMKMHVAGDLLVQSNVGSLLLGYPGNGNRWSMSTINGGADMLYLSKPNASSTYTPRFKMRQSGEFQVGDVSVARAWLQIQQNSGVEKVHLLLEETQDEFARLGFGNTVHEDAQWHIAATSRDGTTGAADSKMNFYFRNDQGAADRMTILGSGQVGINNSNPDEELVIGSNLGSGWVIPAVTVGNSSGGAIEVGTAAIGFSASASTTFGRTRLIATDANGFGQGKIEMRTRQLNVGIAPGVNDTRGYPIRIQQNTGTTGGEYGLFLYNGTNSTENWEFYVGTTAANGGNMTLYHNNASRGTFDQTSGNYSPTSDARLKTNISALSSVLPRLLQLQPKVYNYKTNLDRKYHGFLAQDLQTVFPELVTTISPKADEEATLLVDYSQLTVLAIAALQEQQQVIDQQQEQLTQQAKQLQALEERLQKLEALLEK